MTEHKNDKGIIHTTSYEQLNFIRDNMTQENARRLIVTDPEIQREKEIKEHINCTKPTVLISPSLQTGFDLMDELSRFQIITKVPYPNKSDRWINAKMASLKDITCSSLILVCTAEKPNSSY